MKGYKFYGWERADVPAASGEYKQIKDPKHLYDLLSEIWCADTCAPRMRDSWTKENMTLGQCSITAFLAQDIFGGDVYGILRDGGNYHCYNVVGDCVFDLTSEQFGDEVLSYEDNPMQLREVHFAKEEKRLRYEFLKAELGKRLSCDYYNTNAESFFQNTVTVDFSNAQRIFLSKLEKGAYILDFGCGSGRDTRAFLEQGYRVEATDGSAELCKLAAQYTGIPVRTMLFQELSEVSRYDGIWACASILHLSVDALSEVMRKMAVALKEGGIIYTSFKYGTFSGERNGRYFTDMTEETFAGFISNIPGLAIEEQWLSADVRPGRGEEQWLNLILRKCDIH